MEKQDQRNFIIAMVLMFGFLFGYQKMVLEPQAKLQKAQQEAAAELEANTSPTVAGTETGITDTETGKPIAQLEIEEALLTYPRLRFASSDVDGSIRLKGARLDDLSLRDYYKTVERKEEVRLFRPENAEFGYFATYYWSEDGILVAGRNSEWQLVGEGTLRPDNPIRLRLETDNLLIEREIALDEHSMFTFTDKVTNTSSSVRTLIPLGSIERHGDWKDFTHAVDIGARRSSALVHMGVVGILDGKLRKQKYKPMFKGKTIKGEVDGLLPTTKGGWFALTDKYWMGALIPQQEAPFSGQLNRPRLLAGKGLELRTIGETLTLQPGASLTAQNRIFAGAKGYNVLKSYQEDLGIPRMIDAIDWGVMYFLTRPFFLILVWLKGVTGSFGLAILAFTLLVKLPLVPLFNQSYKSMAKMKKLQEPMKEIQERFKEDPERRQKEIMALYKREKANPAGGCLPMIVTIPVFYSLYKTLMVSIEMRHAPFLWMKDLSAPDPTAIGNLFGLLPWASADVKAVPVIGIIIGIGVLPILYGITMLALQSLSPPPPDPSQRRIMLMLPIVFPFVFASFAGGLVMYYVWSNLLSLLQQYFIMRRNGVETQFDKLLAHLLKKEPKESG